MSRFYHISHSILSSSCVIHAYLSQCYRDMWMAILYAYHIWLMWKGRNEKLFQNGVMNQMVTVRRAMYSFEHGFGPWTCWNKMALGIWGCHILQMFTDPPRQTRLLKAPTTRLYQNQLWAINSSKQWSHSLRTPNFKIRCHQQQSTKFRVHRWRRSFAFWTCPLHGRGNKRQQNPCGVQAVREVV